MAFNVGSVVAKIDADISGFKKGMIEVQDTVSGFKNKLNNLNDQLASFRNTVNLAGAVALGGMSLFLKDASAEASAFEKALTSLDIIAGRFGVSGDKAKQAAIDLGKQLRIGTASAAESIQNLLKTGLTLDQSTELIKRFTNEAITGKSSSISLAQAVQNLSFAYATGNSALGNMSGISENFSDITEKGRQALIKEGIAVNKITDDMAKYRGMIDLTNLTLGSSDRFTGTLVDTQAQLDQKITDLKVAIGRQLNPVLNQLLKLVVGSGLIEGLAKMGHVISDLAFIVGSIFKNNIDNAREGLFNFIQIFEGDDDKAQQLADQFDWILTSLSSFVGWIKDNKEIVFSFFTGLVIAIGSLALVANTIAMVTTLIATLTSPITLVVLAITALYMAWQTNFLGIRDITQQIADFLVWAFVNYIQPAIQLFLMWWQNTFAPAMVSVWNNFLKPAMEAFRAFFAAHWDEIKAIVNLAWAIIKGIIQIAWGWISGFINVGLELMAGDWAGAWQAMKDAAAMIWEGIKSIFTGIVDFIKSWGGEILHNIVKPFEDAWNKVKEIANKIKDAMDPNKRHSPSLVDRVRQGVDDLNKAWGNLSIPITASPTMAGLADSIPTATTSTGGINIDLRGSTISSEADAQRLAEIVGDNIIKKLQLNLRF